MYIHDPLHVPGLEELYYDIEPGFYYEFYIRKITTVSWLITYGHH